MRSRPPARGAMLSDKICPIFSVNRGDLLMVLIKSLLFPCLQLVAPPLLQSRTPYYETDDQMKSNFVSTFSLRHLTDYGN